MEGELRKNGQKATIVIATDGQSSDGDIATVSLTSDTFYKHFSKTFHNSQAMRPLQSLPVWVVIRLCTDNDSVVDYWNNIDGQLELDMDVLDDFASEAKEVSRL